MNKKNTNKEEKQIKDEETESSAGEAAEEIKAPEPEEKKEKNLGKELDIINKQLEEEKDRYLRLNADFDNLRKRTLKEKDEFMKYANEKLILELVDVYESLERGIENAKKANDKDKLIEGMELVYKQFKNVLEKNGLTPIKALGEKFDHYKHEAMMQTITDECDEGIILEEFARGYMLNGKVIRYSKVRVSKKKESEENIEDIEGKIE
ncbi:MAG: nucleotide exchange factor GrpE [Candidatus Methanoperedens sp.]|nr:nucleotide exchange factor GrpE [Candidatus Methanoperedens sp.]MCZ7404154.1 nucleotide exchange factor GrpE [Candidatus Methanoperedens sp.]